MTDECGAYRYRYELIVDCDEEASAAFTDMLVSLASLKGMTTERLVQTIRQPAVNEANAPLPPRTFAILVDDKAATA